PWAHGHQFKAITTFVAAIFEKQTGNQAQLARTQHNQEAGCKRLSRLLHNGRLPPKWLAEGICHQALSQLPRHGKVRFAIDWTSEGAQHLLVVSLVIGRRAVPIFWRAYDQAVLKGRRGRYELAVVKRAFKLIFSYVSPPRVRLTADRGFADTELFDLLSELKIRFIIRVKSCVKVCHRGAWVKLKTLRFAGNARHRTLGRVLYCESSPRRLWLTMSRARDKDGKLALWYLISNQSWRATRAAHEYGHRFCCEIVFPQMTKAHFFTSRAGRDHVTDFNPTVIDDDTINEQFDQLPALGESELRQRRLQPPAEILNPFSQPDEVELLPGLRLEFCQLLREAGASLLEFPALPLEFRAVNGL